MEILHEWLDEKISYHTVGVLEERKIKHHWKKATGGRIMEAGISISIEPSEDFKIEILAEGIEESYITASKNAVITALLSTYFSPILNVRVVLSEFEVVQTNASYLSFYAVTKEAVLLVLGVGEDEKNNVSQ